jgi:hypothetical protein
LGGAAKERKKVAKTESENQLQEAARKCKKVQKSEISGQPRIDTDKHGFIGDVIRMGLRMW